MRETLADGALGLMLYVLLAAVAAGFIQRAYARHRRSKHDGVYVPKCGFCMVGDDPSFAVAVWPVTVLYYAMKHGIVKPWARTLTLIREATAGRLDPPSA